MKTLTELGYLGFEVSNLAHWESFASEVLGLGVKHGPQAGTRYLRMDDHHHRFILTEGPADDCAFAGWRVNDAFAVDAFGKHLDARGVGWSWASDDELTLRAVPRMLHFKDPAGNRHEVYCGPRLATDRFASAKVGGGFVTGAGGLGHVVYSSPDYPKSVAFAHQVLGLAATDLIRQQMGPNPEMQFEVSFMHTNERHHSYAVAPQPPFPGPHKRIHHVMIEVRSIEQVGFARDRCLDAGQPVVMDIGQHPNDKMISFYGQTPSGFQVEFGWGGVKVDAANWQVATYDKFSEWGHRPAALPTAHRASGA